MNKKIKDLAHYLDALGFNMRVVNNRGGFYQADVLLNTDFEDISDYAMLLVDRTSEGGTRIDGAFFLCPKESSPIQGYSETLIPVVSEEPLYSLVMSQFYR